MSWRDAPLYVESYDLSRDLMDRATRKPADLYLKEATPLALEILDRVSLALTFPDRRVPLLRQADEAVVRLRMRLRLAIEAGSLSSGAFRKLSGQLLAIGRMLGGWQRRLEPGARAPPVQQKSGE